MQQSRQVWLPRPVQSLSGYAAGLVKHSLHRLLETLHLVILRVLPLNLGPYQTAVHALPVLVGSSERVSVSVSVSGPC